MIFIYKNLHNKMGRSWKEADAPPFNHFKVYFIFTVKDCHIYSS